MTKSEPTSPEDDRLLASATPAEFACLVLERNSVKKLGPLRSSAAFGGALQRTARSWPTVSDADRLTVLVALGLIARLAHKRQQRPSIDELYARSLTPPFPSLFGLAERDDREWAAEALHAVPGDDAAQALAAVVALEETAEFARETAFSGLMRNRGSVGVALAAVVEAIGRWKPDTIDVTKSRSGRLIRILRTLPKALADLNVQRFPRVRPKIDEFAGKAVADLVVAGLKGSSAPVDDVRDDLTRAVMAALAELLGRRFSICTRSVTFAPVAVCEAWYRPSEWGEACSTFDEIDAVQGALQEALVVLVRQDVVDDDLWRQFARVCGSERTARELGRELAASDTSLPARARAWLLAERAAIQAPDASDLSSNDLEVLAQAWVDMEAALRGSPDLVERMRDELGFSAPPLLARFERQVAVSGVALEAMRRLAARHRLSLHGVLGEVVEFSAKQHRAIDGVGAREVRVVRPGVTWSRSDRVTEIVLRADVEVA